VTGEQEREHVLELANQAVRAAMREDWETASRAMQAISDDAGGDGALLALIAWCDWLIISQNRARSREDEAVAELARPVWLDPETRRLVTNADDVPPAVRWAGQLVSARAAMDMHTFNALLSALPADAKTRGTYAGALLQACAIEMRSTQGDTQ
jgi:hypothetical protein